MAIVNRQDYFDGALNLLADAGHGNLRLTSLCRSLGVTSGSFYNWFKDWNEFVEQFLQYWLAEQTEAVAAEAEQTLPGDRLTKMRELAEHLPHAAEVAMRSWSSTDPRVAAVQRESDRLRVEAIEHALHDLGFGAEPARRFAELALAIVIGHQHHDITGLDWSLTQFIALTQVHAAALAANDTAAHLD